MKIWNFVFHYSAQCTTATYKTFQPIVSRLKVGGRRSLTDHAGANLPLQHKLMLDNWIAAFITGQAQALPQYPRAQQPFQLPQVFL